MQPDGYRPTIPFPSPSRLPRSATGEVRYAAQRGCLEELVEAFPLAVVAAFAVAQLDASAPPFPGTERDVAGALDQPELTRLVPGRKEVSR